MRENYILRDVNAGLPVLAHALLADGNDVGTRQGSRALELCFVGVTLTTPLNREILLPSRKASLPAQIAESVWVLSGRDDIAWLSNYLPRAGDFSDDGETWRGAYGPRLRRWLDNTDQLSNVVALLKADSLTRRAVMSIYDPGQDFVPDSKDIPCNNWLSFLNRNGRLDLHVAIRSNDLVWGWSGINAFEWSVLLEVVAHLVGVQPGELHFSISSLHSYEQHWGRLKSIADDKPVPATEPSPRFDLKGGRLEHLDALLSRWFTVESLIRSDLVGENEIKTLIREFHEPMLRSWLWVIAFYWTGDASYLEPLEGTPLYMAATLSPQPKAHPPQESSPAPAVESFDAYVSGLHASKSAAYGDSWKRRGEMLGIMANIARKVDRLGKTDDNETAADTAIDLLVYLMKYRLWLNENAGAPMPFGDQLKTVTDEVEAIDRLLHLMPKDGANINPERVETYLAQRFEELETAVTSGSTLRYQIVSDMIVDANRLARHLWWKQQNETRAWNPEPRDDGRAEGMNEPAPVEKVGVKASWPYEPTNPQARCETPHPIYGGRSACVRAQGHEGQHGHAGMRWS